MTKPHTFTVEEMDLFKEATGVLRRGGRTDLADFMQSAMDRYLRKETFLAQVREASNCDVMLNWLRNNGYADVAERLTGGKSGG